jgi:hypothetical protein
VTIITTDVLSDTTIMISVGIANDSTTASAMSASSSSARPRIQSFLLTKARYCVEKEELAAKVRDMRVTKTFIIASVFKQSADIRAAGSVAIPNRALFHCRPAPRFQCQKKTEGVGCGNRPRFLSIKTVFVTLKLGARGASCAVKRVHDYCPNGIVEPPTCSSVRLFYYGVEPSKTTQFIPES